MINIILDSGEVVVDVDYYYIPISPLQIFYLKLRDLKQYSSSSDVYVTRISNCNVKIVLKNTVASIIPVRIIKTTGKGSGSDFFQYFGILVKNPLNSLTTPLRYPFKIEPITKLYPEDYKITQTSESETLAAYKFAKQNMEILGLVNDVVLATDLDECTNACIGYVISWNKLKGEDSLKGVIVIQPKRRCDLVMYIPSETSEISSDDILMISKFMDYEEVSLKNFHFMVSKK
jgi:hypothetical protein